MELTLLTTGLHLGLIPRPKATGCGLNTKITTTMTALALHVGSQHASDSTIELFVVSIFVLMALVMEINALALATWNLRSWCQTESIHAVGMLTLTMKPSHTLVEALIAAQWTQYGSCTATSSASQLD